MVTVLSLGFGKAEGHCSQWIVQVRKQEEVIKIAFSIRRNRPQYVSSTSRAGEVGDG
jgi:hypothetical protein